MEIPLTQGKVAIIDAADADLCRYKWHAIRQGNTWYARTNITVSGRPAKTRQKTVLMHRLVVGAEVGQEVDHQDGDGLNNCRSNLRVCTKQENARNRKAGRSKLGVKGVKYNLRNRKWEARIHVNGKTRYLGLHPTKEL